MLPCRRAGAYDTVMMALQTHKIYTPVQVQVSLWMCRAAVTMHGSMCVRSIFVVYMHARSHSHAGVLVM
jgi:hypothetical protein